METTAKVTAMLSAVCSLLFLFALCEDGILGHTMKTIGRFGMLAFLSTIVITLIKVQMDAKELDKKFKQNGGNRRNRS